MLQIIVEAAPLVPQSMHTFLTSHFLAFPSDITEEDLEEAGVHDTSHKQILLESLRQQQQK